MRQSEKEGDPKGKELLQTMASRVNRLNGIRNEFCLCFGYFSPGSQLLMYSPSEVKDYLEWFIILCVRFFYSIPRQIPRSDEKWAVCPDFIVYKVPASLSSHLQSAICVLNWSLETSDCHFLQTLTSEQIFKTEYIFQPCSKILMR